MTLRFFRRKSGDSKDEETDPPAKTKPAAEGKASPRRRTSSSSTSSTRSSRAKTASKPSTDDKKATDEKKPAPRSRPRAAAKPEEEEKPAKPRTRRGRRGGVKRSASRAATAAKAADTTEAPPAESAPSPATRSRGRQPATAQDIATQQMETLKGLQGSLAAIENRLKSGGDRSSALADRPRIALFVDVPNIMYGAERERVVLDYGKVLDYIIGNRELVRASAYAPISDDPDEKLETQKFVEPFVDLGYRIVTKPLKRFANGTIKANFDVELAIDVLTMSDRLDTVVLLSGDGDFRRLVEIVESKGVRVEVVAFGNSTAAELRAVADEYTDLNEHVKELRVTK